MPFRPHKKEDLRPRFSYPTGFFPLLLLFNLEEIYQGGSLSIKTAVMYVLATGKEEEEHQAEGQEVGAAAGRQVLPDIGLVQGKELLV